MALLLAAAVWLGLGWFAPPAAAGATEVALVVNGSPVRADVPPRILSGRTMVPIRIVSENLGAQVDWDAASRSIAIRRGQRRVHLAVGQTEAVIDERPVALDVAPVILDGRTLVPLRFVGEALGAEVAWDEASRTVSVRPGQHGLTDVSVHPDSDRGRLRLHLSGAAEVQVTAVDGGSGGRPQIIVDLSHTETLLAQPEFPVGLAGVVRGRVGPHPADPTTLRVVLELEQAVPYRMARADNGRDVVLEFPYRVTGVRHVQDQDGQAVFIEANGPVSPRSSTLSDPPRIVIDLPGTTAGPGLSPSLDVGEGVVRRVRAAQFDHDTVRVVVDLTQDVDYTVQPVHHGVVIKTRRPGNVEPWGPVLAGRTIVIDAGHGGKDPGSTSHSGIHEKHIVLQMAQLTAQVLTEAGARVVMIRSDDRFIDLYDRAHMANTSGGHAFISIHANAYHNSSLHGTETYYYPGSVPGQRLAQLLHRELLAALGLPDRGVRSADFVVLRETRMPAALVEAAYITHPEGERLLTDPQGQMAVAQAILRALVAFFQ